MSSQLETLVSELTEACETLVEDNQRLRIEQEQLRGQVRSLSDKQQVVRSRVAGMIDRLQLIEQHP